MTVGGGHTTLISVHPDELKFKFFGSYWLGNVIRKTMILIDPPTNCACGMVLFRLSLKCVPTLILVKKFAKQAKVVNNTEQHVAFKVKTTSPKKYFVWPNTSVIQPWDACFIRVILQAQQEYLPDIQCRDKFLLQSTVVPPHSDVDDLSPDIFNRDAAKVVEERKLKVVYVSANVAAENPEDNGLRSARQSLDSSSDQALQQLKEERDSAVRQAQQLQQELDMMKRRRYHRKSDPGFSFRFAFLVALIGIMVGFLVNFTLSSPVT